MSEVQDNKQGASLYHSQSKLTAETIVGEHEHTIQGYSLLKGLGDGEPIASEKFVVGGHEWVLLFYPDGKKSSSTENPHLIPGGINGIPNARNPQQYLQQLHNHHNQNNDHFDLNNSFNYLGLQTPPNPPTTNAQTNNNNATNNNNNNSNNHNSNNGATGGGSSNNNNTNDSNSNILNTINALNNNNNTPGQFHPPSISQGQTGNTAETLHGLQHGLFQQIQSLSQNLGIPQAQLGSLTGQNVANTNNDTQNPNTGLQNQGALPIPMLLAAAQLVQQQQQQQQQQVEPQQTGSQQNQGQQQQQNQQVQQQNQIAMAHNLINQAHQAASYLQFPPVLGRARRENDYAALFVALIGEASPNPQGVVTTSDGKVVRAFHRFTLVDQLNNERHLIKGRSREDSAVKISCSKQAQNQDPNARNCHGYRKFVKKSILEDPNKGFIKDDTLIIRYRIELVVTQGGVLNRNQNQQQKVQDLVRPPPFALNKDFLGLYKGQEGCDVKFQVAERVFSAHKLIVMARSAVFRALLDSYWKEGNQECIRIEDMRPEVFEVLLHYIYTDNIPESGHKSDNYYSNNREESEYFTSPFAQHLLAAADKFELQRLKRICEKRLVEDIDAETVATTLVLADHNNAQELKRVCMEYIAKNLHQVMQTDGWTYLMSSAPQLQDLILQATATYIESQETAHKNAPHPPQSQPPQSQPQAPQQQALQVQQQPQPTSQQQPQPQQQQPPQSQQQSQFFPIPSLQIQQPQFYPVQQWQYRSGVGIRSQRDMEDESSRRVRQRRE